MEGCPYCRLVHEAPTELGLNAIFYLCPENAERYRPQVTALGGKAHSPFLIGPNTDTKMSESTDSLEYLEETYAVA